MPNYPKGSEWRKWDLHIHSIYSCEHRAKLSHQEIFEAASQDEVAVISITDHSNVDGLDEAWSLWEDGKNSGGEKYSDIITFFPGVELKADSGKRGVHFIVVFPPITHANGYSQKVDKSFLKESFLSKIGCSESDIKGCAQGCYKKGLFNIAVSFEETSKLVRKLGGIVIVHSGNKDHSLESEISHPSSMANTDELLNTLGNKKEDLMRDCVDICELPNWSNYHQKQQQFYFSKFRKPSVVFSDSHESYNNECPTWIKADPTFEGLRQVLNEPTDRVCIQGPPSIFEHIRQNKPYYMDSVTIKPVGNEPGWFNDTIPLSKNLIAIIGNKGTGKSALADIISLLGNTKRAAKFSFLESHKFRDKKTGKASQFQAEISWLDGEISGPKRLDSDPDTGSVQRVKYLPQNFLDEICTDLTTSQDNQFYYELQGVIFSHLQEHERLGCDSLAELLQQVSEETERQIQSKANKIADINKAIVRLRKKLVPEIRIELINNLDEKKRFVKQTWENKPRRILKPVEKVEREEQKEILTQINEIQMRLDFLSNLTANHEEERIAISKKLSIANNLSEYLDWVEEKIEEFRNGIANLSEPINIGVDKIFQIRIDKTSIKKRIENYREELKGLDKLLGNQEIEYSIEWEVTPLLYRIGQFKEELNKSEREYQEYLEIRQAWMGKVLSGIGQKHEPERGSIRKLQKELYGLDDIPGRISELEQAMFVHADEIYQLKTTLKEKYRQFHTPVQEFISDHDIAQQDRFPLFFQVSIADEGFSKSFFSYVSQGVNGSFCGTEQGRTRLADIIDRTDFNDKISVLGFLKEIISNLKKDYRYDPPTQAIISTQLKKNIEEDQLLNMLFSLSYLKPIYNLQWEDKGVEQLSPGERGQLLLIFYLLIDRDENPLIIDQPEENLDNQTVFEVLVPCIKEAKDKRQVILVTHNPNLAVVCDAEQIIHVAMDKKNHNTICYTPGAIENESINRKIVDVLEGTEPAFTVRKSKYQFTGKHPV